MVLEFAILNMRGKLIVLTEAIKKISSLYYFTLNWLHTKHLIYPRAFWFTSIGFIYSLVSSFYWRLFWQIAFIFPQRSLSRAGNAYAKMENYAEAIRYYDFSLAEHRSPDTINRLNQVCLIDVFCHANTPKEMHFVFAWCGLSMRLKV